MKFWTLIGLDKGIDTSMGKINVVLIIHTKFCARTGQSA